MNVLIIGSGAREFAIASALKKDKRVDSIYFAPGNGASDMLGKNLSFGSYLELITVAKEKNVGLVIVGPEQPLVEGVADMFRSVGFAVFGPSKNAARLEASKSFMKAFATRYGIKTARYLESSSKDEAFAFIDSLTPPIVVKADGLCAGKGVIIANSKDEAKETVVSMLNGDAFGSAGKKVVIEEFLDGYELSVFAISDGESYRILPPCQDHKRLKDNDEGPNTGGMGAYAPTPLCDENLLKKIEDRIVSPAIKGCKDEGFPFEGVLFCGIMVVDGEPYLLEFNVRFGDPECEVLMPLLDSSALDLFYKCAKKDIDTLELRFKKGFAMCVVAASKEYPYSNPEPKPITQKTPDPKLAENSFIYYAGVKRIGGVLHASGGRVLCVSGIGESLEDAKRAAYSRMECISFEGMQFRRDIGSRAFK